MSAKKAKTELAPKDVLYMFESKGALLTGHFQLTSGLHSERYLQSALVLQHPELAERLGAGIARKFHRSRIDCVVGPAIGGIVIAQEVGRALGVRSMFTEREAGMMKFRRGFSVREGEHILIVEDVTTTGGSVNEVISVIEQAGSIVVGVGAIIDRSGGNVKFEKPFRPLARLQVLTFKADVCPLCKRGVPVTKPGSRKI